MRIYLVIIIVFLLFSTCTEKINTSDMIISVTASPDNVLADGSSTISLSVELNEDIDRRNVFFKVDKGGFVDNKNADSITVVAEKINQKLIAFTKLQVPSSPGTINLEVQMLLPDQKGRYVFSKEITVAKSVVTNIQLVANSFSVFNNFDGEVQLTGLLSNSTHKGVSLDYRVVIEDVNSSFVPIHGQFRDAKLSSNGSSQVLATYSPGFIAPGQSIYLISTVLDGNGKKTSISDTISLAVNQKH